MKKRICIIASILALTFGSSITCIAGSWQQNQIGFWYQNDDGSYPTNSWMQDSDGKWYYFDENGYMLHDQWIGNYYVGSSGEMLINTTTPDGYQVGPDGAWIQPNAQTAEQTVTLGMKNAVKKAQQYLKYMSFSRKGLIKQLEYEGFSSSEATYAVDAVGADWEAQCAKKAEAYLKYTSFSRAGLKKQLEYEGFTGSEVAFGLLAVGY